MGRRSNYDMKVNDVEIKITEKLRFHEFCVIDLNVWLPNVSVQFFFLFERLPNYSQQRVFEISGA